MTNQLTRKPQSITYGDSKSHALLWQKAIVLLPLWALLLVPFIGMIIRSFGPVAVQLGYGLILALCAGYLFEDLLKRKISMDDEYLYFGFKAIPIKSIVSIDVTYRKRVVLPQYLVLTRDTGKSLKLSISGLTEEGIEKLLKHLQSRNSGLKTAIVLSTLIKCRRVNPKPVVDTKEKLAVSYHERQVLEETLEIFRTSARQWMRLGPLVVFVLAAPVWLPFISMVYVCLHPSATASFDSINLLRFLGQFFSGINFAMGGILKGTSESMIHFAEQPLVAFATTAALVVAAVAFVYRVLCTPNLLLADPKGIKLLFSLGDFSVPRGQISWSALCRAELFKPPGNAGVERWKVRLTDGNRSKFDFSLSALSLEDRARLLKRIENFAPACEIDPDLAQSMMPKSERTYTELWLQSLTQAPERKTMDPLEPGQKIAEGRFLLVKRLGVGGQGTAYLCRVSDDASTTVVLKETILPVFVDQSVRRNALEKFEHEARMLQSLDNPRIVKLLDYFIEDHRSYLVLEHIDGLSLREMVLRDGPLASEVVHDLALQMCDILRVLHGQGVVHRDFTPDNLILNSSSMLKLIDFNVAQQLKAGSSGTIVGKHAYLPPEQFRGKATSQSDLYAMGATLFFLLTGCDPEPISQSSPASVHPDIDASLDYIVRKATALQCEKRYATSEELEQDLICENSQVPNNILLVTNLEAEVTVNG